jgi:hypothetical protein
LAYDHALARLQKVSGMIRNKSSVAPLSMCFAVVLLSCGAHASGPKEKLLYRFQGGSDGSQPSAAMIADHSGNLFGTTNSFPGGSGGRAPYGGLVFGKNKALFGTTSYGGDMSCANGQGNGCGSVFKVVP